MSRTYHLHPLDLDPIPCGPDDYADPDPTTIDLSTGSTVRPVRLDCPEAEPRTARRYTIDLDQLCAEWDAARPYDSDPSTDMQPERPMVLR